MKRVAVTGSRNWTEERAVWAALDNIQQQIGPFILVHGGCPTGADAIAHEWARRHGVRVEVFFADWDTGLGAGPARNVAMAESRPDLCLGFPLGPSRGTRGCLREMRRCGVQTYSIEG